MKGKKGLTRKVDREDSMAMPVKVARNIDRLADGVGDEERCEYFLADERCPRRRVAEDGKYCDLHAGWQSAELAGCGAPLPLSPMSMQLFLAKAIDQVLTGQKSDVQVRAVLMLVKLMQRNAAWIWQR